MKSMVLYLGTVTGIQTLGEVTHVTLANKVLKEDHWMTSYVAMVAQGTVATQLQNQQVQAGDVLSVSGRLIPINKEPYVLIEQAAPMFADHLQFAEDARKQKILLHGINQVTVQAPVAKKPTLTNTRALIPNLDMVLRLDSQQHHPTGQRVDLPLWVPVAAFGEAATQHPAHLGENLSVSGMLLKRKKGQSYQTYINAMHVMALPQ